MVSITRQVLAVLRLSETSYKTPPLPSLPLLHAYSSSRLLRLLVSVIASLFLSHAQTTPTEKNFMAAQDAVHRARLNDFLQSMVNDGLVDSHFTHLQNIKATTGKDAVIRAVVSYNTTAKQLFSTMTNLLDMEFVDFYEVIGCVLDLYERSISFGAVLISNTCPYILECCHARDKHNCISGLTVAKRELARLQPKLETILQMERKIIDSEDLLDRQSHS